MGICKKLKLPLIVHFHGWDVSRNDLIDKLDRHLTQLQKVIQEAINVRIPAIPKDSSKPC
ncbi:MAG: hypothetical protein KA807_09525 [Prolixibacteraceae bacterium]|nr:hypothetical protein [Prolixibacteraceae bacterium]